MENAMRVTDLTKEEVKEVMKEALREWLDDKFADFGKWSLVGVGASTLALLAYFILISNGWTHK